MFLENVEINSIDILYYDRIEVSEGININKKSASREYIICHYGYFLDKRFKFQPMNLNNITLLNIHDFDSCCIINGISRNNVHHVWWYWNWKIETSLLYKSNFLKGYWYW